MRLIKAHVTNFRSVEDSTVFTVEPETTCLVGKNESGKTATLQALFRVEPVDKSVKFDEVLDFPARRYAQRLKAPEKKLIPVVVATYRFTDDELAEIEDDLGKGAVISPFVTVTTGYRANRTVSIEYDEKRILDHMVSGLDLPAAKVTALAATKCFKDAAEVLREWDERPADATRLLESLDKWKTAWELLWADYVARFLPTFVYFGDYDTMPGKRSIPDLIRRRDAGALDRGEIALLSLLKLAGTKPEEFLQTDRHERLIRAFQNAGVAISEEAFEYWSQNNDLEVELEILQPEQGAQPPLNEGPILQVRVRNQRHKATVPFDDRSRGFVWFFSFLAYFNDIESQVKGNIILLLDEPGLSLHGRAQEDLLKLIDKRLAIKHQVIYTTHSPFMVDPDHMERVRTVMDKDKVGTQVSAEIYRADEDTAFPLLHAMGIELAQTLYVGEHTLLLEGPSDLIYLDVLSDAVSEQSGVGLDPRWIKTPVGGAGKLSTFASLFGANKLNVAVVVDSSTKDVGAVKHLRDNGQLASKGLVEMSEFTGSKDADVEDLFDRTFYLELVNLAYAAQLASPIALGDLNSSDPRIVRQIEGYFKKHSINNGRFDHYKPAAYLMRNQDTLVPQIDTATLNKASLLFKRLNDLITP